MSPLAGFKTNRCLFFYNLFIPSGLKAVRLCMFVINTIAIHFSKFRRNDIMVVNKKSRRF
jgi:hypothetical protein